MSSFSFYLYREVKVLGSDSDDSVDVRTLYQTAKRQNDESAEVTSPLTDEVVVTTEETKNYTFDECVDCKERVSELISDAVEAIPSTTVVTSSNTQTVSTSTSTSYIPFGTTATSTSTDWYTLPDSGTYLDINNEFSSDAYVSFEASLKVKHGNGQAYVRLWDDTNKIAVVGSELSTIGNEDYVLVKSNNLNLWSGNNNYKVQIKSLTGYEVTYTGGKLKIVY